MHNASVRKALHHDTQIVTVCLHLRVKRERLTAVHEWYERGAQQAHAHRGHVLSTLVVPATSANARYAPVRDVLVVYAFATQVDADAWHASAEKKALMVELAGLVDSSVVLGKDSALSKTDPTWGAAHSGWEAIFSSDDFLARENFSVVPPRWRTCVAVYLAVVGVVIPLSLPGSLNEVIAVGIGVPAQPWLVVVAILLGNLVSTPLICFVALPFIIKVLSPWLHAAKPDPPTPESSAMFRHSYDFCC